MISESSELGSAYLQQQRSRFQKLNPGSRATALVIIFLVNRSIGPFCI